MRWNWKLQKQNVIVHSFCKQCSCLYKMLVGNSQTLLVLHRSGAGCAIASLNKKSRQLQVEMKLAVLFKSFLLIDQLQTHNFEVDKIKTFCIFMVVSFCSASELSAKTTNIDFQFTRGNRTVFIQWNARWSYTVINDKYKLINLAAFFTNLFTFNSGCPWQFRRL